MLDIAIIGAGPAGLSAAITGMQRHKKIQVFGNESITSYLAKAEKIDNYLGLPGISGEEMMQHFTAHAQRLGVPIQRGRVIEIFPMGEYYTLNVENEFVETKTIILANGLLKTNQYEGENEFLGRGVSYCATCDGPLYKGRVVAIIGDSLLAEEEANYLSEICEKVYYIPLYKIISHLNPEIEIIRDLPHRILGESVVKGIDFETKSLDVEGVFIIRESIAVQRLLKELKIENHAISVNRQMATNLKGVFAAGDCTGRPYQVAKAVGEGNIAVLEAIKYLNAMGE